MQPFFVELYNLPLSGQIPPTPEEKRKLSELIRNTQERYSLFVSAHQDLPIIYSPHRTFAFSWRKDWWEKDYLSFWKEYKNLRHFLQDYLEGRLSEESRTWFHQVLKSLRLDFSFSEKNSHIQLHLIGDIVSETENEHLFGLAYWGIIDVLRSGKIISRCQAPKTQKTPACENLFIPHEKGKKQLYCSPKCANRVRRHKYYHKCGK